MKTQLIKSALILLGMVLATNNAYAQLPDPGFTIDGTIASHVYTTEALKKELNH